jgi:hypothetical protein
MIIYHDNVIKISMWKDLIECKNNTFLVIYSFNYYIWTVYNVLETLQCTKFDFYSEADFSLEKVIAIQ